jgi:hypothetical protein
MVTVHQVGIQLNRSAIWLQRARRNSILARKIPSDPTFRPDETEHGLTSLTQETH